MGGLKLPKLPDRTPVKLAVVLSPDLYRALGDYAAIYKRTYGQEEPVTEMVPRLLASFLASDRGFAKACERMASDQP